MWSKRLREPPAVVSTYSGGGGYSGYTKKTITWPNQYEYDEWMKNQPYRRGMLLCGDYQKDVTILPYPHFLVILAIVDDYTEMTYSYNNGKPKYLVVGSLFTTPELPEQKNIRFDDGTYFREISEKEKEWVKTNVVLQDNLKKCYAYANREVQEYLARSRAANESTV